MKKTEYRRIEGYMLAQMKDSAHDRHHIYRVLNFALDIAGHAAACDMDVLLAACLLHDIGREQQFADLELCHAEIGGGMAHTFLLSLGWPEDRALHVKACIATHRYRRESRPGSVEAEILFDADKLDACGAIGLARTLAYSGQIAEPLYIMDEAGDILTAGGGAEISSFFQEYNYKLKHVYDAFYTARAKEIALARQKAAVDFYDSLFSELTENYENGLKRYAPFLRES